jgi:DNA-binding transcriptional LysR family regulator
VERLLTASAHYSYVFTWSKLSTPMSGRWGSGGSRITVPVRGGYEADDSRSLGDAAYAGLGIGVRLSGECAAAEREGRLERVLPSYRFQPLDVYALIPKGRGRVPRVAACIEVLRAAVLELV